MKGELPTAVMIAVMIRCLPPSGASGDPSSVRSRGALGPEQPASDRAERTPTRACEKASLQGRCQ
jgi:hypothetical protein